jgi:hypothetical protein
LIYVKIIKLVNERQGLQENSCGTCDKCKKSKIDLIYHQDLDCMLCKECIEKIEGLNEWKCAKCKKEMDSVTFINGEPYCDSCANEETINEELSGRRLGDYF